MKRIAVLLVILMVSAVPASIDREFSLSTDKEIVFPSTSVNCSNQTHGGGSFFVDSTNGNDSWSGTYACPKGTIQSAVDLVAENGTVVVREGVYYETVTLGKQGVRLKAAEGERVILDGSRSVSNDLGGIWEIYDSTSTEGTVWKANLSEQAWQFFVDYEEEMPARWPNANFSDGTALNDDEYWGHGSVDVGDYETDSSTECNEGMVKHQNGNKYYCLNYINGELEDDNSSYLGHDGLIESGINATGAIAVLNIGSFRTWSRNVTSHNASNGSFTFQEVPSSEWKYKHHMYFLTQKLELLDVPGEWFFDHESPGNTVYYMPREGSNPNDLNIRMKTRAYSVLCTDNDDVIVEGFDYFASTFNLDDCDGSEIRNSTLLYPSTSKRSLGFAGEDMDDRFVSRVDDCIGCIVDSCDFLYTDGAAFEAHGGSSSSQNNTINNSYFYHIDWSGSDQKSLMTTIMMDGTANRFTNNTMHKTGTSATIRIGNSPQIMFNEIYDTAYLQSDGTVVQMMQAEQQGATVAYNWIHDVPKYGIRMDGPFGGTNSGRNASVHHNVLWNANGAIVAKGDFHNVSNNTVLLGSDGDRNHIIVLYDSTGGNENSTIMSNVADSISGHRTNSNDSNPIPVNNSTIGNNWNGYDSQNVGENVSSMLISPLSKDFRPIIGSEIDLLGAGAYSSTQNATTPADPSSFDPSSFYWLPGIKRDSSSPFVQTTFDLPCPSGKYRSSVGESCEEAGVGQHAPLWGSISAIDCLAGTWNNLTGQSYCLNASSGHFVDSNGSTSQTPCPMGTWNNLTGQVSCTNASAGYYVDANGSSSQTPASAGYYVDANGSSSQTPCAVGTWNNLTGQVSCTNASAGYYVDANGSATQTPCDAGTYNPMNGSNSSTDCVDVPTGNYSIPGSPSPIPCLEGTWQNQTGQPSCMNASAGYYVDANGSASQTPCELGTWQNQTGQVSCTNASAGYYVDANGSSSQTPCAAGTYNPITGSNSTAACLTTPAGNYSGSGASYPIPCSVGTYQSQTGQPSCMNASAGHYVSNPGSIAEIECSSGTWTNLTGQSACALASPGYYVDSNGSTTQTPCPTGSYNYNTGSSNPLDCLDSSPGYYVDQEGQSAQTACPAGTYNNITGSTTADDCIDAEPGYYVTNPGSTSQSPCQLGEFQPSMGQSSCIDAEPGNYVDSLASTSQIACSPGSFQADSGQTGCETANIGHYVDISGSASETPCSAGTYNSLTGSVVSTDCLEADPGYFVSSSGSSSQVACSTGSYQPESGATSCIYATPGHYVDQTAATSQKNCEKGEFQPSTARDSCVTAGIGYYVDSAESSSQTKCPQGSYNPDTGSISSDDCSDSEPGYYVPSLGSGAGAQVPCSAGTYQSAYGMTECTLAEEGYFVNTTQSTSPTPCPAGTYQPNTGQVICLNAGDGHFVAGTGQSDHTPCPIGTYQPDVGSTQCVDASPGYFVEETGSTTQTGCPAGAYQPGEGAENCITTEAGYYVSGTRATEKTPCEPGTWQNLTGQTSCNVAEPGYHTPNSGATEQVKCSNGTFQSEFGSTDCISSEPGYYVSLDGMAVPTACPPGTYQTAGGQSTCTEASPGYYTNSSGSTRQTACEPGEWQELAGQTECKEAQAGFYVAAPGSVDQNICEVGTYQPETGQSSCIDAPAGYFVGSPGSTSVTGCPSGEHQPEPGSSTCVEKPINPLLIVGGLGVLIALVAVSIIGFRAYKRKQEAEFEAMMSEGMDGTGEDVSDDSIETEISLDYSTMTVAQLKEELQERDLVISGVKAELISRLEDDDEQLERYKARLGKIDDSVEEEVDDKLDEDDADEDADLDLGLDEDDADEDGEEIVPSEVDDEFEEANDEIEEELTEDEFDEFDEFDMD